MANSLFRVGGHYTAFIYNGIQLGYAQMINERAPQPVAQPQPIQPLDSEYPIEIAIPGAIQAGTIEITFLELWGAEVWAQLGPPFSNILTDPTTGNQRAVGDLLDVFKAQLLQNSQNKSANSGITCSKVITKPDGSQRMVNYHNCYVVNAQIDELIQIGTMTIPKTITLMYLRRTESTFTA